MLRTRVISALVLVPIILAIVLLGEPWLSILIGVAAFLALVELVGLLDAAGHQPPQVLTIVGGMTLVAAGLITTNGESVGGAVAHLVVALDPPGLVTATMVAVMLVLAAVGVHALRPTGGLHDLGDDLVRGGLHRPAHAGDGAGGPSRPGRRVGEHSGRRARAWAPAPRGHCCWSWWSGDTTPAPT